MAGFYLNLSNDKRTDIARHLKHCPTVVVVKYLIPQLQKWNVQMDGTKPLKLTPKANKQETTHFLAIFF